MTFGQAEKIYTDWLVARTGDNGFKNKEVMQVLYYTRARKRRKAGWKLVFACHLTLGASFGEELLEDYIKLGVVEFAIKHAQ